MHTNNFHPLAATSLRWLLVVVLAWGALLAPRSASAQDAIHLSLRQLGNVTHFRGVEQAAIEALIPAAGGRFVHDWIVSAGVINDRIRESTFVSLGRAVTLHSSSRRLALHASFSPTLTETDQLNGRDFGGHFYFTSAVSLRMYLDASRTRAIALRAQHTSNGGLAESNPGLDLAGMELVWRFGE